MASRRLSALSIEHCKLERLVAIKVLPASQSDELSRTRFLREARTAAQLSHPNIVPIYHAAETAGLAFFIMAYVDGASLADRVQSAGLPTTDVVPWLREGWCIATARVSKAGSGVQGEG